MFLKDSETVRAYFLGGRVTCAHVHVHRSGCPCVSASEENLGCCCLDTVHLAYFILFLRYNLLLAWVLHI